MIVSLLALAALTPPSLPQSNDTVSLLVNQYDTVSGLGFSRRLLRLSTPRTGSAGGWIAHGEVASNDQMILFGRLPSMPVDEVQILRHPASLDGMAQWVLGPGALSSTGIAYVARTRPGATQVETSVWLDDQRLIRDGDLIPGSSSRWIDFSNVYQTESGRTLVIGTATQLPAGPGPNVIYDATNQQVLLAMGAQLAGLPSPIDALSTGLVHSPSGNHWGLRVWTGNQTISVLVVDGEVYDFGGGALAVEGEPVPATMTSFAPGATWTYMNTLIGLNDAGDVCADGNYRVPGSDQAFQALRNGIPVVRAPGGSLYGESVGSRGEILGGFYSGSTRIPYIESAPALDGFALLDFDGDGIADPPWRVSQSYTRFAPAATGHETLAYTRISQHFTAGTEAIVRGRPYRVDTVACDGVANSTGRAAEAIASGSHLATDNDLVLQAYALPQQTVGFFLMSRTFAVTVQPGGSVGNLCLSGAVGRLDQQLFSTGVYDSGQAVVDLAMVPQPTGNVAATAGETWFAQAWYRDAVLGVATSNFTSAVAVTFQ